LPRYFFHLRDGSDVLLDPEGRRITDPTTIPELALEEARSLMSHEVLDGRIRLDQRIEVEDEAGAVVHALEFADAVQIVRMPRAV
jgi:hypothetical protein